MPKTRRANKKHKQNQAPLTNIITAGNRGLPVAITEYIPDNTTLVNISATCKTCATWAHKDLTVRKNAYNNEQWEIYLIEERERQLDWEDYLREHVPREEPPNDEDP